MKLTASEKERLGKTLARVEDNKARAARMAARARNPEHLSQAEAIDALRMFRLGMTYAEIASATGRDPSNVRRAVVREDLAEEARLVAAEEAAEARDLKRLSRKQGAA